MSSEEKIEQEIQDKGIKSPRLTPDDVNKKIKGGHNRNPGRGS